MWMDCLTAPVALESSQGTQGRNGRCGVACELMEPSGGSRCVIAGRGRGLVGALLRDREGCAVSWGTEYGR